MTNTNNIETKKNKTNKAICDWGIAYESICDFL